MTTPAPNGAPAVAPTPAKAATMPPAANGATAAPPPEAPKPPEADPRLKELEAQTKRFAAQQRKFSEERQAFEKQRSEEAGKLKEYEEWKTYHADRLRNPVKYLEKDYGPEWYDRLTQTKLTGIPTPDLVASEMDARLGDFEKKLQAREAEVNKRFEEMKAAEQQRATEAFHQELISEVKRGLEKYPAIAAFADDPSVWASITAEVDGHFKQNSHAILAGEMELLTAEEAASRVNKRIEAIGQKFEKAKQAKQPAATQPPELNKQRSEPPQRRTLSTDMTATSGTDWVPPKDDKERLERAKAAWERAKQNRAPL